MIKLGKGLGMRLADSITGYQILLPELTNYNSSSSPECCVSNYKPPHRESSQCC